MASPKDVKSIYKEGFLNKAGKRSFQAWKKRWFVLHGTLVKYYPTQDTSESNTLGAIDFSQVVTLGVSRNTKFGFDVATKTRTYYLSGKNEEEREQWMGAFQDAMKIASEKDQEERAALSPGLKSPLRHEHQQFFEQRSVSKESADVKEEKQEQLYESIDDIEMIMAEAEKQSDLENAMSEDGQKIKQEIIEAPSVALPGRSPKLDRSRNARLSDLAENEIEDDIADADATQAGISNLLSKMSLESLDSIDSENLLDTSDDEEDRVFSEGEEPEDAEESRVKSSEPENVVPLDVPDGDVSTLGRINAAGSAFSKVKELLGIDDDYRCSMTLQDVQKMYNVEVDGNTEFPAFELLRKVLQVNE